MITMNVPSCSDVDLHLFRIKVLSETPTASPRIKTNYVKSKPTSFFAGIPKRKAPVVRSVPSSPAVAAARAQATNLSPANITSTNSEKMEALKFPLLHLVAIRPMSLKFLANKVSCSQEDCKQILEKHGKPFRLDPDKWDLTDRAFKELSVWDFKYELDDDRQLAIDHAVSAFDRLRLSREDRAWQMLLPEEERGKGKILSKLQVHQGPLQKSVTPRIHVQETEDQVKEGQPAHTDGDEKDYLTPADAATPSARAQPSDPTKKKRISEQEAQSKRLLSSGPKKAAAAAATKAKETKAKEMAKRKASRKEGTTQANVKSAEFVHDSDEEEEEAKVSAPSAPKPPAAVTKSSGTNLKASPVSKPQPANAAPRKGPEVATQKSSRASELSNGNSTNNRDRSQSTSGTLVSQHRSSDASQTSSSAPKLSRQRTTSSPHKPSPLGSSPPTNASDFDNDSQVQMTSNSSTSSTPVNAQSRNPTTGLKPRPEATKRLPDPTEKSSQPSLKRKADDSPSGSSAGDKQPLTNGHAAAKRVKTSVPTPPATEPSSNESSPISDTVIGQARKFKNYYEKYQRFYRELSAQDNAATEKIEQLMRMHERLQSMKDEINQAVG